MSQRIEEHWEAGDGSEQGDLQSRGVQFHFPGRAYPRPFAGVDFERGDTVAHSGCADDGLYFGDFLVADPHVPGDADIKIKIPGQSVACVETKFSDRRPFVHQAGVGDVEEIIVLAEEPGVYGDGLMANSAVQPEFDIAKVKVRLVGSDRRACDGPAILLAQRVVQAEKNHVGVWCERFVFQKIHRLIPCLANACIALLCQFATGALDSGANGVVTRAGALEQDVAAALAKPFVSVQE